MRGRLWGANICSLIAVRIRLTMFVFCRAASIFSSRCADSGMYSVTAWTGSRTGAGAAVGDGARAVFAGSVAATSGGRLSDGGFVSVM